MYSISQLFYRRGNGQQGYVPANYVKDIEPATVMKKVKKKVIENVPVKTKKTQVVKRRVRKPTRDRSSARYSCK